MGLNESKHKKTIYLNIVGGKIVRRYKEHEPEENGKKVTFDREIKDKNTGEVIKTVIERPYNDVDGTLTNAKIDSEGKFGAMLVFDMIDGEEFTLSIPLESNYGRAIMMKIPNVDPNKVTTFAPFNFEGTNKKGEVKKIVGVNIFQDGEKIPYKWTKAEPGNLPDWEVTEVAGKKKWNSDKQTNFLAKHFEQWAKSVGGVVAPEQLSPSTPEYTGLEQEVAFANSQQEQSPPPGLMDDEGEIDTDLQF